MKMPNFRLYDTQATFGATLGVLGLLAIFALGVLVFKNFDTQQKVIWYNPASKGLTRFREPAVLAVAAATVLIGGVAGVLGFNSLGQKRNNRQGMSWLGLALGALSIVLAALALVAWMRMRIPIIPSA